MPNEFKIILTYFWCLFKSRCNEKYEQKLSLKIEVKRWYQQNVSVQQLTKGCLEVPSMNEMKSDKA